MANPFFTLGTTLEGHTAKVLKKLIGIKKGDFVVFNYKELEMNPSNLRPAIQYVINKYLFGAKYKTKHNEDKTELWATLK